MENKKVKLKFLGAAGSVTGSNFLVEILDKKVLVDCGLFQGDSNSEEKNFEEFDFDPSSIDFLFVTHGHLDHIGRIPKLIKDGFKGKIFSTPVTKEISHFILSDALKIMGFKERDGGRTALYSESDLRSSFEMWQTKDYGEEIGVDDVAKVVFRNAGHILGSAMVEIRPFGREEKLVLTGDLGSWPNPLLPKTENLEGVKYLVMESVYGDRNHESLEGRNKHFQSSIEKTIKKGGTVLIPAFSLERTQVILFELNRLVENNIIPSVPVFLDSPLAIKLTEIYRNSSKLFNENAQKLIQEGDRIFSFPKLKITESAGESRKIEDNNNSKIIIAGSGMSQGGRIVRHEAEYLPDEKNTLLLLGYQAVGTLGRLLQDGEKGVEIDGKMVKVRAEIEYIDGFSAHRDSDGLVEFVGETDGDIKKIFLAMGEPKAALFLAQRLKDTFGINCVAPKVGESFILDF